MRAAMCILGNKSRSSAKAARFEPLICLSGPFTSPVNSTSPKIQFCEAVFQLTACSSFLPEFQKLRVSEFSFIRRTFFKFFIEKVPGTNSLRFCLFPPHTRACLFAALSFAKRFPMFLPCAERYFLSGHWEYFF